MRPARSLAKGFCGKHMQLTLNGKPYEFRGGKTVAALLDSLALTARVAVAVNGKVSPRSEHASHVLVEGDEVEVIHAVAGG